MGGLSMKRLKTLALNGFLMAGGLLVALLIAEGVVRVAFPQPAAVSRQDRYGLVMHWPDLNTYLPQFGLRASFNSSGMRDR